MALCFAAVGSQVSMAFPIAISFTLQGPMAKTLLDSTTKMWMCDSTMCTVDLLLPSLNQKMSQEEKNVRDDLVQLHKLELKVPFAPIIHSTNDGLKYAVGLGHSGPNIGTYEEIRE